MYSKSMGTSDFRARRDAPPATGTREPAYRHVVRVPPNYSGHAFRDGEERSPEQMMSQPSRSGATADSQRDRPPHGEEPPTPRFDDLPRVSTLGHRDGVRSAPPMEIAPSRSDLPHGDLPPFEETASHTSAETDEGCPDERTRLPALPPCRGAAGGCDRDGKRPGGAGESGVLQGLMERFPFGHGFGFEELLLVGLMLLLLHEGNGDGDLGETLVLLGVLLLCG